MVIGGDDLEENFVLDGSYSSSESEEDFQQQQDSPQGLHESKDLTSQSENDDEVIAATPPAKKQKLNWREAASNRSGDAEAQRQILESSIVAAAKYFPNFAPPFDSSDLRELCFLDATDFMAQESRSVRDMFEFVKKRSDIPSTGSHKLPGLTTLVIVGSATRGMYMVKELREMDASSAPLPLFFHGGGRKKEQARTHESVLKAKKASVAVCLPSRLRSAAEEGLIDFSTVQLVLFDLKQNEKRLNVMSQKETMLDLLEVLGNHIIPKRNRDLQIALI